MQVHKINWRLRNEPAVFGVVLAYTINTICLKLCKGKKKQRVKSELIYTFADFADTTIVHWTRLLKLIIFSWLFQMCATSTPIL